MHLGIDADALNACVGCGLCLPQCPTYRVTTEEVASPRGRIAAMRQVQDGGAPITDAFIESMETCVQCRGCETACPSGVQYGQLIEATRSTLAAEHRTVPRWQRVGYWGLGRPRLLQAGSRLLAVAQRARLVPKRLGLPPLPLWQRRLRSSAAGTGTDVWLYTGCVMDAWMRDTHRAVQAVVEAAGATVAISPGGCCGALHSHAGLHDQVLSLARRTMASMTGDAPILVDSAGCGAALRDYGHLVGTPEAAAFAARVVDVHSWLAERIDRLPPPRPGAVRPTVAVQDPCHLRHVQKAHLPVRTVLAPYADLVELDDEGLCCGAGGAYSSLQPELAVAIRERKLASIGRSGAPLVASANPGCAMHLAGAGVETRHPLEIVAEAIRGR